MGSTLLTAASKAWLTRHSPTADIYNSKQYWVGVLDLGIKVDPGAVSVCQGGPVGCDGANILHQGEADAGGVGGSWQGVLQLSTEDVCTGCH